MSYSCLEELQTILDLHMSNKTKVLSDAGCKYNKGKDWFIITDDGYCHHFDKDGNLDDIKKIKHLKENYIRKDIKKIIIPNGIVSIGNDAFYCCDRLISITIPNSVTRIGNGAFYNCSRLTSITIPDSVTNISNWTFYNCNNLTNVTIPYCVTSIGMCAFENCSSLTSVTIPNNMINIEDYAFEGCNNLKSLVFKGKTLKEVKRMDNYPFGIENKSIIKCVK